MDLPAQSLLVAENTAPDTYLHQHADDSFDLGFAQAKTSGRETPVRNTKHRASPRARIGPAPVLATAYQGKMDGAEASAFSYPLSTR